MVNYDVDKKSKVITKERSYWGEVTYRLRKNKMAMLSLYVLIVVIALCIVVPMFSPYAIQTTNMDKSIRDQSPSNEHLLGTDKIGRDLFTRLFYAGRISLGVALAVVALECTMGVVLGSIAGF